MYRHGDGEIAFLQANMAAALSGLREASFFKGADDLS